jgi:hypothetical protein
MSSSDALSWMDFKGLRLMCQSMGINCHRMLTRVCIEP